MSTHPNIIKGESQAARLWDLLRDGKAHTTVEICEKVYGAAHLGIARIAARVYDLNKKLQEEDYPFKVVNMPHEGTITKYQLKEYAR